MDQWIRDLFAHPELLRMGHCQRLQDLNLGMGWLYYGLARLIRPQKAVVIGSWRGFTPLVFGKALADNAEGGVVYFIDPSQADNFWKDEVKTKTYFESFGINNIQHFLMTTQEFAESNEYKKIDKVGIVFVDGLHTEEQVRFDYEAFERLLSDDGMFLFHDSLSTSKVRWLYDPEQRYERRVGSFIDELKTRVPLQVMDLPFAKGLTLVRKNFSESR